MNYLETHRHELDSIQKDLERRCAEWRQGQPSAKLAEAMAYTLLSEGKRFRPLLALLAAEALGADKTKLVPFASAVEMIHAYSLIHDDLPCMDDDDFRRGQPTNHKVFGEAMALLAGDALLTEAFSVVGRAYAMETNVAGKLLWRMSALVGAYGMVGGQALDIQLGAKPVELVEKIHRLKTGQLIELAVDGAAIVCGATPAQQEALRRYAQSLGLAFQIADDLEDHAEEGGALVDHDSPTTDSVNYVHGAGMISARQRLEELTRSAITAIEIILPKPQRLIELARFNLQRAQGLQS